MFRAGLQIKLCFDNNNFLTISLLRAQKIFLIVERNSAFVRYREQFLPVVLPALNKSLIWPNSNKLQAR